MKTILVATDFSPASLNAANYAADMALTCGLNLLLFHAYEIHPFYSEVPLSEPVNNMQRDAEEDINKVKFELMKRTAGNVEVNSEVRMGNFFTALQSVCDYLHPKAVVMGSQGTTAVERLFFGGHTTYAVDHLMWPLIAVPPGAYFSAVKNIGLACDFNEVAATVPIDEIKAIVGDFKATLHILNSGKKKVFDPEIIFQSQVLEEKLSPLKPYYHFITNVDINAGIINFTEQHNIDLLIVLPKRHSLPNKLIHKSHSKHMLLHCHVPVMALHLN